MYSVVLVPHDRDMLGQANPYSLFYFLAYWEYNTYERLIFSFDVR